MRLLLLFAGLTRALTTARLPPVSGYTRMLLNNAAINIPHDREIETTYITHKRFPADVSLDIPRCAQACKDETACRCFNIYQLMKNGQPDAQICALYTQVVDGTYATNEGQWRGEDQYTIQDSWAFGASPDAISCSA
jgi:hypothetical protein